MQPVPDRIAEGQRLMGICNACRYCEGYCAVFPAMERRMVFTPSDIRYLANLCHNCAECYYACQYAPPHEFAVNVPQVFAQIRAQSYEQYAWPRSAWRLLKTWGWIAFLPATALLPLVANPGGARFYDVIPHSSMVAIFGAAFLWIAIAKTVGVFRFWRDSGLRFAQLFRPAALIQGIRDAATLKNLDSGGVGCTYPDERHSRARRWFHHLTFYGFFLCFASTVTAAMNHYLGSQAPYPYLSLPVTLGTLGGLGLLIGPAGLYGLKRRRDSRIADSSQDGMDLSFLAALFFTSLTGLALLALRETRAMPTLLVIHLILVLALFLKLPYGKFVHGVYRTLALIRNAAEKLNPPQPAPGD